MKMYGPFTHKVILMSKQERKSKQLTEINFKSDTAQGTAPNLLNSSSVQFDE